MKFVIVSSFAFIHHCHKWCKPLNPIIGETYQAIMDDGATLNVEQVSHHPPISYIILDGPNNIYRFSGYYAFDLRASLNSMTLDVKGFRTVSF